MARWRSFDIQQIQFKYFLFKLCSKSLMYTNIAWLPAWKFSQLGTLKSQLAGRKDDDDDDDDAGTDEVIPLSNPLLSADPYEVGIMPPNRLRTTRGNPFNMAERVREKATVMKRLTGSEDVVLFERKRLEEDEEEDEEDELDTLLQGDSVALSMESIDLNKDKSKRRFLIKTDSDLDLLVHEPGKLEEVRAHGRWLWAALQNCPPWRTYMKIALVMLGTVILYIIVVIVILQLVGAG